MIWEFLGADVQLANADCREALREIPDNYVDALVTDPPGGGEFMCSWDSDKGGKAHWITWLAGVMSECFRVCKPGAYALVWSFPRTSHWTASAIEDGGFEIQNIVPHLQGGRMPKSKGTLKSGADVWWLARKPVARGASDAGALQIDVCRIAGESGSGHWSADDNTDGGSRPGYDGGFTRGGTKNLAGRHPSNVLLSHGDGCRLLGMKQVRSNGSIAADTAAAASRRTETATVYGADDRARGEWQPYGNGDGTETVEDWECAADCPIGGLGASARYFYAARAPSQERWFFCTVCAEPHPLVEMGRHTHDRVDDNHVVIHPTVKSIMLMSWLIRLVTPPGGVVLDAFAGTGTTGIAARQQGFKFIGVEEDRRYFEIIKARLR